MRIILIGDRVYLGILWNGKTETVELGEAMDLIRRIEESGGRRKIS